MIKKIITSLGMVVFAAAIVVGGTGAFFSDTETSTGNVFTAGAIDLTVDSEAHYNGSICLPNLKTTEITTDYTWQGGEEYPVGLPCTGTWEATNLGAQTFFNYDDVKPGDEGENTISLHVDNNPAWACIDVNLTKNDDNDVTEPEDAEPLEGDTEIVPDGDFMDGELAQNMKFAAWLDQGNTPGWQGKRVNGEVPTGDVGEGDNIWQGEEVEPLLFSNESGPASDVLGGKSYALADSSTLGGPITPLVTNYIGLAWCAGKQVVDKALNKITCDGSALGNIVQTDSMEASIAFRVEQHRNNPTFRCTPGTTPTPETATVNVDKAVQFTDLAIEGVDVADFTLTIDGPGAPMVVVDNVPTAGLPVGTYSISEAYSGVPSNVTYNASFSGGCTEVGDTGVGTMNVVAGVNPTCVITNAVTLLPV